MKKQQGFAHVWVFVIVLLVIIGLVFFKVAKSSGGHNMERKSSGSSDTVAANNHQTISSPPHNTQAFFNAVVKPTDPQFIKATPFDLNQVKAISEYRSCAGHDFSYLDANSVHEYDRSMKHYIEPLDSLLGTSNQIKLFAPFTGRVYAIDPPQIGGGGSIDFAVPGSKTLALTYGHANPLQDIKQGSQVTAGQLVGYADVQGSDFDLVLRPVTGASSYFLDAFAYMDPQVLAAFAAHGITQDNIVVSKEYRDAHPCGFPAPSHNATGGNNGNGKLTNPSIDFVTLSHGV